MDIIAGASLARRKVNLPFSIVKTRTGYRASLSLPDQGQSRDLEIGSIGGKTKIAEVNLLGLTGDLDGTLTPRVVKTIETCSPLVASARTIIVAARSGAATVSMANTASAKILRG